MEALNELCDIIEQNPKQFLDKLPWICQQCPQPKQLRAESPRVSQSHLNAVLSVTRILSRNLDTSQNDAKFVVLDFLQVLRSSFRRSFWPYSYTLESISAFYFSFLGYVSCLSPEFGTIVVELVMMSCCGETESDDRDQSISMAFLVAVSQHFPTIQQSDGDKLVTLLLHQFAADELSIGYSKDVFLHKVASFEDESIECLEKQEIAFKLVTNVLCQVKLDSRLYLQVRAIANRQLQSMSAFLKSRRQDWNTQDPLLKTSVNAKLFVYQAAAQMEIGSLMSLETDGKKRLIMESLTLLIDTAEACFTSLWRNMKACKDLFISMLSGTAKIAAAEAGQPLRLFLTRLKPLILAVCAQPDTRVSSQGNMFESVFRISCEIIESGWAKDQASVNAFIVGLASSIRERYDYEEKDDREKQVPDVLVNVIQLLADISVAVQNPEVADIIFQFFIESLEECDVSTPRSLRLQLLEAVSRIASLGFDKSYRQTVVLMSRSYLSQISRLESVESNTSAPKSRSEHIETLPAGFLTIACGLMKTKLRADYRHRLLSLCSDVGLASESKSGGSGAEFLGPLLPAVAEICSDFDPTSNVEPSLIKLFRNLWFYIALFGLAPPILDTPLPEVKTTSNSVNSAGRISTFSLRAVLGPYMWNTQWALAVKRISLGTPPLVVSSAKWLEDELELNLLHNSDSLRGTGNKKVASTQRTALSIAVGGRIDVSTILTISGVKATYLLAVALLEVIRFISNGGILNGGSSVSASRSAFSCVFEYLKSRNLNSAVSECLTAIVHRAFEVAVSWLEDHKSRTGYDASIIESTAEAHACFLIKSMSQRDEHIRDISVNLLSQIREKFPQVLWSSSCLDSLLFSVHDKTPSTVVNDPAWTAAVRSLYQKVVREWIIISLSYAPCTSQGLLQDKLCKANTLPLTQTTTNVISLLAEIKIGTGKNEIWSGIRTANIPAVMAAAAAASGANLKTSGAFNLEVLSTSVVSATVKCNHTGQIAGMLRLENSVGGFSINEITSVVSATVKCNHTGQIAGMLRLENSVGGFSINEMLISNSVRLLQQFVSTAEKGGEVDKSQFRETCSQATALLLLNLQADEPKTTIKGFSQLLRLLCWCPAYMLTPDAMETGVFIWTWLVSAAPQLGSLVLAELVDAWIWTIDSKRGLFASDVRYYGPAAKLRPQLCPGEPENPPESDPVDQILAHRLWLGFLIDRFEVVRHSNGEQLLLLGRLLQRSTNLDWCFTRHPAAAGTFFSLMLLGLRFSSCQRQGNMQKIRHELQLSEDRIYRTSLGWFARLPEWYDVNIANFCESEALSVSRFLHFLQNKQSDSTESGSKAIARGNGNLIDVIDHYHPVWGEMDNSAVGKEKRKQLLLILCQHESDRLDVWAQPISPKDSPFSRLKISSEKWTEYAKTAFSVDPRIAISLASRFPANIALKSQVIQLVQAHLVDLRTIPEALPYFVTPKTAEENPVLLHQLPHWAACSITQVLEFLTPAYKGHPRVMAYVLRVLEFYPPERVTFFMPQLVQSLRYDEERLVEGYLLRAAQKSDIFAHILIWHLQSESVQEIVKDGAFDKNASFQAILSEVRQHIVDGFTPKALDLFRREFDFFEKVTSISGALFPLPKEKRRAGIRRELRKIKMQGEELYLPTAPNKLVRGIQVDSGIPLQSAAKVPIMITFNVVDRDGDHNDVKPQACIFKVGDDCRQDVLALQVISLLRDIFQAAGLNLYLFPYGVLPTGAERGIIEVVPNTRSRSQMGETTDGGLYEVFQQNYGPVGSTTFETARENFLISSAGYAVASLLLQPKDRHNGNLLFDDVGKLVHIDFGFILETSPGGNMRFESAHFKLSHEMTQLLDPSGVMKSKTWHQFVSLCVKGYLAARRHMDGIISTVQMMLHSGLPCFSIGDPIGNLRKRFHPEMSEREAAQFMIHVCSDAYNKWSTAGYDLIQYLQQGVEK
ncbi:PREDICTED: phosphatidylinositol 4-kinase alpha 1-like [Camelina sativa]|uniref:Phosphatidylinositol 4-kinase alpha 1-like n=1 Tax=Camelina sativa TaxID=90675 RepID=A0ABM0X2C1_CAMSA|nr:PREDICTED: phosphatidylinositol 4-kinase alpha 1-like [Camelina sativa]